MSLKNVVVGICIAFWYVQALIVKNKYYFNEEALTACLMFTLNVVNPVIRK